MTKITLPEKLIDSVYTRLYPQALPGTLTYIQKVEQILSRYLGQLLQDEAGTEIECDCGVVGCMTMIDGKCHICRDAYDRLCQPCCEAFADSDTYLDYQAGQAEEDQMEEPENFENVEDEWD